MEADGTILGHKDYLALASRTLLLHLSTQILKQVDYMQQLILLLVTSVSPVETHSAEIEVK